WSGSPRPWRPARSGSHRDASRSAYRDSSCTARKAQDRTASDRRTRGCLTTRSSGVSVRSCSVLSVRVRPAHHKLALVLVEQPQPLGILADGLNRLVHRVVPDLRLDALVSRPLAFELV